MTTPNNRSAMSRLAVATLLATLLCGSAAHASSEPRLLAREVAGDYVMEDGRTLRIDVVRGRAMVEAEAAEYWTARSPDLLVSPDGMRTISLLRNPSGVVQRIELRITR